MARNTKYSYNERFNIMNVWRYILLLCAWLLLVSAEAWGANWYVRPSGGSYGDEDGTSYANAWDGFSSIVWGAGGVVAGDTLYVAGTHRELMRVAASGSAGNIITIASYGADPATINGAVICDGAGDDWTETGAGTNIWWYALGATLPDVVMVNGEAWTMVQDETRCAGAGNPWVCCTGAGVGACEGLSGLGAKEWYYCNTCDDATDDRLYIYSTTDPDTAYPNQIEASQRNNGIILDGYDYIAIDGIEFKYHGTSYKPQFRYSSAVGDYDNVGTDYSTYITINSCTFNNNAIAITCRNADSGYWTISNNVINGHGDTKGIIVYGPSNITISGNIIDGGRSAIYIATASNNITVSNNTVTRYGMHGVMNDVQSFGIHLAAITGIGDYLISGNTIRNPQADYDAYELSWYGAPNSIIVTENNFYQDGSLYGDSGIVVNTYDAGEATITHNYIDNVSKIGIYRGGGDGDTIAYNKINGGCSSYAIGLITTSWNGADRTATNHNVYYNLIHGVGNGIILYENTATTPTGHNIFNNTVYGASSDYSLRISDTNENATIKNNIFYDGGATYFINVANDQGRTGFASDNNIYYGTAYWNWGTDADDTSLADWRTALGGCPNAGNDCDSLTSDPLFVSAGTNFHLRSTSPAIDAGTDVGLTRDYDGTTVPLREGFDIGAQEFIGCFEMRRIIGGNVY